MLGAFAGEHIIEFKKSKVTPGGTTLVHGEDYCGWMTWMFGDWPLGIARSGAVKIFADYAEDLKRRVEALKQINASSG